MAILKIARMGHPVLSLRAREVPDPSASEIRHLVNDMVETMIDANGAGLAAPQVHAPLRVVVFQAPDTRADPGLSEAEEIQSRRANGIPLHKEVLQWFAECTKEMGLAPLAAMR